VIISSEEIKQLQFLDILISGDLEGILVLLLNSG
jgi:hypothetical protein